MKEAMGHALTVDLEDWHQIYRRASTGRLGPPSESVIRCTQRILDRLDGARARATFFVVGQLARDRPQLVREIAACGHEIASHSYDHRRLYELTPAEVTDDLLRSKHELERLCGQAVIGFRAPEHSIRSLADPVFETLARLGYRYDSSIVPARTPIRTTVAGGAVHHVADAPATPFRITTRCGTITEFPIATVSLFGTRAPLGGSALRIVWTRRITDAVRELEAAGVPATVYIHPYEFTDEPLLPDRLGLADIKHLRWLFVHNFLTRKIDARISAMLRAFHFSPLRERHADTIAA